VRSIERTPRQELVISAVQPGAGDAPAAPGGGSSTRDGAAAAVGNATGADAPGNAIVPGNVVGVCDQAIEATPTSISTVAPIPARLLIAPPSLALREV